MHKHLFIDAKMLVKKFEMDASRFGLYARSFTDYRKKLAIDVFFPYSTPRDSSGKTLINGLSPKDWILHFFDL